MKAFKEWRKKVTSRELGCPDLVWEAALKWVLTRCEKLDVDFCLDCNCFNAVENIIEEELENE